MVKVDKKLFIKGINLVAAWEFFGLILWMMNLDESSTYLYSAVVASKEEVTRYMHTTHLI